jgi:hypothetical protein
MLIADEASVVAATAVVFDLMCGVLADVWGRSIASPTSNNCRLCLYLE